MLSKNKSVISNLNLIVIVSLFGLICCAFAVSVTVFSSNKNAENQKSVVQPTPARKPQDKKNPGGQTSAITSPSGKIAFSRLDSGNREIWTLNNVGTTNDTERMQEVSMNQEPVFSPDGKKILFKSFRDRDFPNFGSLYSMNHDFYDQTRLTNSAQLETYFSYSTDSTKIVFTRDDDIWTMNADGTNQTILTIDNATAVSPSFSPDDTKIVYSEETDGSDIRLMNADGTNQTGVTGDGNNPKFTPNGAKIIFDRNGNIYTINLDGTGETELINGNGDTLSSPQFSPNGAKILMKCEPTSDIDICVANADGSDLHSVGLANVEESYPVWSPDSAKIAYIHRAFSTSDYKIFTVNADGSSATEVYSAGSGLTLQSLSWQPVCISLPPIIPTNLVSWWRGEGNADDSLGINNGTFISGANYATGKIGQAFNFNGNGNYVEVPDSPSLNVQTGNYTLAAWVKINSSREHFIAGKGGCNGGNSAFYMGVDNLNQVFLDISHSSGGTRAGGPVLTIGQWHHLVMTKEGTIHKLFIDGGYDFQIDVPGIFEINDKPFTIGKGDACTAPQLTMDGAIDEVHLYNRTLSDTEIDTLFDGNNPPCPPTSEPRVEVKINYPNPVAGGRNAEGEVRLTQAAPAGGTVINLASTDTGVITVPATVTIPENSNQATFSITSTLGSTFRSADVIATVGADTARATVSVAPSAPDLAASNLNAPATVNILENFTASWTVTNNGEAATANFRQDEIWISPDNQLFDGNDTRIAYAGDSVVINPAQSITASVNNVNIPSAAIPVDGTYYLFVRVGTNINERSGNFFNNHTSIPIQVSRNLPDIVANIVAPAEIEPNTLFTISWDLRNAGSRSTQTSFSHNVYLSFDQTVGNADDISITFRASPALGINETGSYSQQVSIPTLPVRPSSDALIYIRVDEGNVVFEGDPGSIAETNNTPTKAVRFEYRVPDLQVQSVTPPAEVDSDTSFSMNWTTINAGNKTAGAMNERVYFSTDNQVNGNDVEIGSFPLSQNLNANQTVNRIQNVTIPTNSVPATGDYFIYVKTDADSQINEGANESNNITFQPIHVRRLLRPDLQVTNITAPATAFFDQEIQVQFTVMNNGTGATNVPQWTDEIYLGLNQTLNGATRVSSFSNISSLNPGESYIASATVRIPRGFNGSYFVIVKTDTENTLNEENENNNLSTRAITLNIPPLPDLRVSNVQAPAEGFAGQPILVSWTVTNNGDGASPNNEATWTDAIYLSTDQNFDGNDRFIGTRQRSGTLAVNGSYTVSNFSVNLPNDVFGNYYVFVQTDYARQVYEFTAENNNTDYDRIQPGSPMNVLGTPPDLTVLSPITAPANSIAGQQITVQFTVRNQGAFDATGSWREAVYISADQTFDVNNDTFLGSVVRNGLPAGQQYGVSLDVTIPNCLQGTYYLFAITDSNSNIFEFDANGNAETNNVSQPKAIDLQSFAPDLRVTNMTVPPIVINGSMPMSWTVKNFGTGATTQTVWHDYVFINTGTQIINLGTFEHQGALAINGEYTQNRVVQIPLYLEGSFQIFVRTDAHNVVPECSFDQNNDDYRVADIQQDLPDLQITGVTSPNTAMLGDSFNVSWTGGNSGAAFGGSTSWADTVYLSSDATPGGDIPIGSTILTANLAANQTYNGQVQVTIPNVAVGNYFLIVNADNSNNVQEGLNENNNTSTAIPITLTAPQVDLQVSNLTTNLTLYAGQFANISWTITNFGSSPTVSATWTDYVILSRDSVFDSTDRILLYQPHNGVLNGGANYTETHSMQIPNGLTGDYNILVFTDRQNYVVENNESNNLSAPFAVNLQLPPPAEFNITNITPPASITLGEEATFTWTVQNSSANTANGVWHDSIYLSTDAVWDSGDALVGQKQMSGSVAPSTTYTETLTTVIPPIDTGNYYVIVRTDARNTIRESNEANNVSGSVGQTTVGVTNLLLGTPFNTTLITGQERFFRILNTPPDETMLVNLTGQNGSSNELYTRFGSMVSRANYEFQGERQGEANQENVVPNTTAGNYYTMIRGDFVPSSFASNLKIANDEKENSAITAQAVTIKAELLPFGIRTVSPAGAGNNGYTMISVEGAKFQTGATLKLVNTSNASVLTPMQTFAISSINVAGLFDLRGKDPGNYYVVLTNPNNQISTWSQNFVISQGGGESLRTEVSGPSEVRGNFYTRFTIAVSNEGKNDAISVPILIVLSANAKNYRLSTANYQEFALPADAVDPNTVHADIDDKRVLALFAPIVRAGETVNIGIDVSFSNRGSITAEALEPIFAPELALLPNALLSPEATGGDVIKCWSNLVFNALLTALSEIFPIKCAKGIAKVMAAAFLGDGITSTAGGARTGNFVSWSTLHGLGFKALRAVEDCAFEGLRYIPLAKLASILWDLNELRKLAVECLKKTAEYNHPVHTNLPNDPNDKVGPFGYGPEKFVPVNSPLPYRINFENKADATAPAHRIRVVDQLPSTLDPRTVRLTEIGFKQYRIVIPPNRSFYQTRMQLGPDLNNLQADVSAGLNIVTGTVTWTLTAIDPATGEEPINPNVGLLPPNNAANDGQGYVSFTVKAKPTMPTRTNLANEATIYFDDNEPIVTNVTSNLLDADLPLSQCSALPATSNVPNISVSWAGSDDPNGSGLAEYDVFVSENGDEYFPFITNTTATSATFNGKYGRTYRFYSIARDNAGNVEAPPTTPDATIRVLGGNFESDVASRPEGDNDGTVNDSDVSQVRRFAAKLDTDFLYNEFQRADAAPRSQRGNGILSVADVIQARRFGLGLDAVVESDGPNAPTPFSANNSTVGGSTSANPKAKSSARKNAAERNSALLPREIRPVKVSRTGNKVVIAAELEAQGDEVGIGFTLNFDTAHLSNPANITLGNGASGATLTVNTMEAAQGRIGIILDKATNQPFAAGVRQLVTIEFDVVINAPLTTLISFTGNPVANEVVEGNAASLTTTFTNASISLAAPTASSVSVGGRVVTADERGMYKARVTLTDSNGNTRTVLTNQFGYYSFTEVSVGETYVLSISHKRYQFVQPTQLLFVIEELYDVNFTASP